MVRVCRTVAYPTKSVCASLAAPKASPKRYGSATRWKHFTQTVRQVVEAPSRQHEKSSRSLRCWYRKISCRQPWNCSMRDSEGDKTMKLRDIAHSRTGDKGNTSNISVIAFDATFYDFLREYVTAERVKAHFAEVVHGEVKRYELPLI